MCSKIHIYILKICRFDGRTDQKTEFNFYGRKKTQQQRCRSEVTWFHCNNGAIRRRCDTAEVREIWWRCARYISLEVHLTQRQRCIRRDGGKSFRHTSVHSAMEWTTSRVYFLLVRGYYRLIGVLRYSLWGIRVGLPLSFPRQC